MCGRNNQFLISLITLLASLFVSVYHLRAHTCCSCKAPLPYGEFKSYIHDTCCHARYDLMYGFCGEEHVHWFNYTVDGDCTKAHRDCECVQHPAGYPYIWSNN